MEGPGFLQTGARRQVRGVRQPAGVQRPGEGAEPRAARPRPRPSRQQRRAGVGRRVRARRRLDLRAGDPAGAGRPGHERHAAPAPAAGRRGSRARHGRCRRDRRWPESRWPSSPRRPPRRWRACRRRRASSPPATRRCWPRWPPSSDDPRRDRAHQTEDGLLRAPAARAAARVSITSGFETTSKPVRVAVRARQDRPPRARADRRAAAPGPAGASWRGSAWRQPARVLVRVRRSGRTVRVLRDACLAPGSKRLRVALGRPRAPPRQAARRAAAGRYRVQVLRALGPQDGQPLRRRHRAQAALAVRRRAHVARLGGGPEQRRQGVAHAPTPLVLRGRLHRPGAAAVAARARRAWRAPRPAPPSSPPGCAAATTPVHAGASGARRARRAGRRSATAPPRAGPARCPRPRGRRLPSGVGHQPRPRHRPRARGAAAARCRLSISHRPAGRVAGNLPRSISRRISRALRPLAREACSMSRLAMTGRQLRHSAAFPCPRWSSRTSPGRPSASA